MKKIFILTGEPSGDKLAAKVISKLKIKDPNISYLCLIAGLYVVLTLIMFMTIKSNFF